MHRLEGTGALVRLVVARDRVRLAVWMLGLVILVAGTAAATKGIYPTQADLDRAAAVAEDNPAALAFNGPAQGLDTLGGQVAFQVGAFGLLMVGLMVLLLVGRLTRAEEDSGRLELVRAMPVGRHAPLAAGLVVVGGALVVTSMVVSAVLLLNGLPAHGSLNFGSSYLAFGLCILGITAVAAQVAENPRVATGTAGAVLGASYALRAVGDMTGGSLSWLSPIGWAQKARPYAGEQWWPLLLLAALAVAFVWTAVVLASHRDFGAGLVAPRRGPARAVASLRSPLALALRLHRGAVFWWAFGTLWLGAVYGSLGDSIDDFVSDNDGMAEVLARFDASLTDSYLATSLLVTALLAAGPGLQIALRLRTEETGQRAEPLLATPMSQHAWVLSHAGVALAGGTLALVVGGFGLGASYAAVSGDAGQVGRMLTASLSHLPAVWVLTGVAVALFGLRPRWAYGAWAALPVAFVVAMFGELFGLPQWLRDLSPFEHTPPVPASSVEVLPLTVLGVLAVGLLVAGFAGFRRRDLVTT